MNPARVGTLLAVFLLAAPTLAQAQTPPAAAPATTTPAAVATPPSPVNDVVLESILSWRIETPADAIRAIDALVNLGRADLAKPIVAQLLARKPSPAELANLARELGSGLFMRLAAEKGLQPESQILADATLGALKAEATDLARLQEFARQLADAARSKQVEAATRLREAGALAVGPLLSTLVDAKLSAGHSLAQATLEDLGAESLAPLIAVLYSNDAAYQVAAAGTLSRAAERAAPGTLNAAVPPLLALAFNDKRPAEVRGAAADAVRSIVGSLPSRELAVDLIAEEVSRLTAVPREGATFPLVPMSDEPVDVWQWSAPERVPQRIQLGESQARAVQAARLAAALLALEPDNPRFQRQWLISGMTVAVLRYGPDGPLPQGPNSIVEESKKLSLATIDAALDQAVRQKQFAAARGLAELIGARATVDHLTESSPEMVGLVRALREGDERTRFAAAAAVVSLKPKKPFAGSSYLGDTLAHFIGSDSSPRALVAFPRAAVVDELAGMLRSLGYEVDTATNGRDFLLALTKRGQYDAVLISSQIQRGTVRNCLEQMRLLGPLAVLPVVIMTESSPAILHDLPRMQVLAERYPHVAALPRPTDPAGMKTAIERVRSDLPAPPSNKLREQRAIAALRWYGQLADANPVVFDPRRYEETLLRALTLQPLSEQAAVVLARLGTHNSQKALVDLASDPSIPIGTRRIAAESFAKSVEQFGIRLLLPEIEAQFNRLKQVPAADTDSKEVLASIVKSLESRAEKK